MAEESKDLPRREREEPGNKNATRELIIKSRLPIGYQMKFIYGWTGARVKAMNGKLFYGFTAMLIVTIVFTLSIRPINDEKFQSLQTDNKGEGGRMRTVCLVCLPGAMWLLLST